jgi:hypothetical protein
MEPPFPGMDPYLEGPTFWASFHHHLAEELMARLNLVLGPAYFADVEVRTALDDLAILAAVDVYPDVSVPHDEAAQYTTAAATTAPIQRLALPADRTRTRTVVIRQADNNILVTAIELLSPTNKQGRGLEVYRQKRERLLHAACHLVEIDLLRRGTRPGWELEEPPLDAAYICLVNRARPDELRVSEIWPILLAMPLPQIPIPLLTPDPDVVVDLQAALHAIYARARYARRIDYRDTPPAPDLSPADTTWLDAQLRAYGLRT